MKKIAKDKLYDLIVNGLPAGLFIVDDHLRIMEFNVPAEKLTGWRREDAIGKHCSDVLKSELCNENCPLRKSAHLGKGYIGHETTIMTKWGEEVPISFSSSALLDGDGRMIAGIEIFSDDTDHHQLMMQRRNFISVFAHDLKAPVAITGGFVLRLLQGKAGDLTSKQRQYLEVIKKENQRLNRYIHDFLDLLRVEAGHVRLTYSTCNVENMLHELAEEFGLKAREKNISISLVLDQELPLVEVDKNQMERVITNLLDNAIKYSDPDSEITARAWEESGFIFFEISDQGVGIPKEDLAHIFEYFYRNRGNEGRVGGTGLGLASAKGIVEAHGGKIWVRSESGKGSKFTVKIPKRPVREEKDIRSQRIK